MSTRKKGHVLQLCSNHMKETGVSSYLAHRREIPYGDSLPGYTTNTGHKYTTWHCSGIFVRCIAQ